MAKQSILAVDDEKDLLKTYENILKKRYLPLLADSAESALDMLKKKKADLVLLDIRMPGTGGLELLEQLKELHTDVDVIMVSASKDLSSAVEAMKLGAYDYITKPFDVGELLSVIEKALEKRGLKKENEYLREAVAVTFPGSELIGEDPKIKAVRELIRTVADAESTVLISGESGTGKEIAARSLHEQSCRREKPFIAINCAAIPENLLESELFGYERGAFTGAMERKTGKFELADTGTLFLDEIGCMPAQMQSKLLRVLEDRKIERLGGSQTIEIDVRIIAATNIDFQKQIKEGRFREDLFYRLNVIPINLPPLRERKSDIGLFISFFISKYNRNLNKKIKGIEKEALKKLMDYDYPGNVRELQNILERAAVLSRSELITEEDLLGIERSEAPEPGSLDEAIRVFERNYIAGILREFEGNQSKAAKKLGIARTTLSSKMVQLGLR